jgi:Zn finger protein HypA/HybF involved in hydrogenase expression
MNINYNEVEEKLEFYCSKCNRKESRAEPYCPRCGASMEVKDMLEHL